MTDNTKRAITLLRDCTDHDDYSIHELGSLLGGATGVNELVEKEIPLYHHNTSNQWTTMKVSRVKSGSTYSYWVSIDFRGYGGSYTLDLTPIPNSTSVDAQEDWQGFVLDDGTLFPELHSYIGSELFEIGGGVIVDNTSTPPTNDFTLVIIGFGTGFMRVEFVDSNFLSIQTNHDLIVGVSKVLVL